MCEMPQLIDCPSGHRLKVPSKHAGHRIRCPVCDESIAVPPLPPPKKGPDARNSDQDLLTAELKSHDVAVLTPSPSAPKAPLQPPAQEFVPPKPDHVFLAPEFPRTSVTSVATEVSKVPEESEPQHGNPELDRPHAEPTAAFSALDSMTDVAVAQPFVEFIVEDRSSRGHQTLTELNERFESEQQKKVRLLGVATIVVSLIFAVPSISDQMASLTGKSIQSSDPWTYLVLLLALVQCSVAIYAMRLPDWSTSWCVALVATATAAVHALVLAMTNFAKPNHALLKYLGLLDEKYHGTASAWCFFVVCLALILAYSHGSFSLRWYQLDRQLGR
jgi:hypothetical protein